MLTRIEDLAFEIEGDTITLEQGYATGQVDRVALHRVHLQHLAEKMGLLQPPSPSVRTLVRRLLTLQGRIEYLADHLANHSDHKHADLSHELTYAIATEDIAREFCAELPADYPSKEGGQ